jgi:hypothetical protein
MDDRKRILTFLHETKSAPDREFGRSLQEIARALGLSVERAEFLPTELDALGEVSLAGATPATMIADV